MKQPQKIYIAQDTPGLAPLVELLQATIDANVCKPFGEWTVALAQPTLTASGDVAISFMALPPQQAAAIQQIIKAYQEVA